MKTGTRARAITALVTIGTFTCAPCPHARAQDLASWRSLRLGHDVGSLTTSTSECPLSGVRTRIAPRTVWALDRPFSARDFTPSKDADTFVPSDDVKAALPSQGADFAAPSGAQRSVTYGVILEAGETTATGTKPCTAAQARSIRVGHFAFLTIDIRFAHVRLEPYLNTTFQLDMLAPDELLSVVSSLADNLPASVFLQMRLASDLGGSLPGWLAAFEAIQRDVVDIAKRLQTAPERETEEQSLETKATAVVKASEELMFRERAVLACEVLQMSARALLERLLAPAPVTDCPAAALAASTLASWRLGSEEDLNAAAVPLLLWRKKVHVSEGMSKQADTPLRLLDLPLLEDVTMAGEPDGFLYEILERSSVRVRKE